MTYLSSRRERHAAKRNAERGASQMKWKKKMLGTVVNKLRSYRKYQETYRELSRLTSRELADLGISRSEISSVARKASV
ncbi:DUF1127 domain-containing protein [Oryzibacter oryziterrae]|uniref:DUF1127 domain-containing protein n=1 Tax=Oryzibacter oryziterrae TaxID=2766474 RepID=UPI0036F2B71F